MALRWAPTAALEVEKSFGKVIGFRHMWTLKAALDHDDRLAQELAA